MTGLDLGLGIPRSRLFLRSRDQDLSYLVSRPRPRPEPPGLETKTKTLATRSRDRDQDLILQISSELEFETLGLEITSLHIVLYLSFSKALEFFRTEAMWCFASFGGLVTAQRVLHGVRVCICMYVYRRALVVD